MHSTPALLGLEDTSMARDPHAFERAPWLDSGYLDNIDMHRSYACWRESVLMLPGGSPFEKLQRFEVETFRRWSGMGRWEPVPSRRFRRRDQVATLVDTLMLLEWPLTNGIIAHPFSWGTSVCEVFV